MLTVSTHLRGIASKALKLKSGKEESRLSIRKIGLQIGHICYTWHFPLLLMLCTVLKTSAALAISTDTPRLHDVNAMAVLIAKT